MLITNTILYYVHLARQLAPTPPDKGSFPLDHKGRCRELVDSYLHCLSEKQHTHNNCKSITQQYLLCRMSNNLMANESLDKYGLGLNTDKIASKSSTT